MAYDLRSFIQALDEEGELLRISREIDWNLEASGITAMANRVDDKIPIFEKLKGYPTGYRLIGDPFRGCPGQLHRRTAFSLGMGLDIPYEDFVREINRRFEMPIPPIIVDSGPCKEVIKKGKEVNILDFPIPYIHDGDGGRYLTMHTLIAKDPDSDWVNWANYRCMVVDRKKLTMLFTPGQQTPSLYYFKYEPRQKPMPVCFAIGGHPASWYLSITPIPAGLSEVDYAGGLAMEPIELVKAETNDLLVPANAEIVFEGEMRPGERVDEGPFGEYLGYMHGPRRPMPLFRVHCITHRKDPIIPMCVEGTEVGESINVSNSAFVSVGINLFTEGFRRMGFPVSSLGVCDINGLGFLLVSSPIPYPGYVRDLSDLLLSYPFISPHFDVVVVLDPDVDLTNMEAVWEEIALKAHPLKDIHNIGRAEGPKSLLNIYQSVEEKGLMKHGMSRSKTAKVYIDATTKCWDETRDGPKRFEFSLLYPKLSTWVEKNRERFNLPRYQDFRHAEVRWLKS
jgi:UbiD family decarboxylase